jgi:hypothetical protein
VANPTEVKTRWTEYLQEQMGKKEADDNEDEELKAYERIEDVKSRTYSNRDELVKAPTSEETDQIIKKQKRNRSPVEDNIKSEMLIRAGLELKEELYKLIKQIWKEESIPPAWITGLICPIHKKGDKSDCNNYRGITSLNNIYKTVTSLQVAENKLGEYKRGFHKGRSTMDQIFVSRQTIVKFHEYGEDLHILFIDHKKAFDSVRRNKLAQAMHKMGIPTELIKLTMMSCCESSELCGRVLRVAPRTVRVQ